jgi:hypothetical protein
VEFAQRKVARATAPGSFAIRRGSISGGIAELGGP